MLLSLCKVPTIITALIINHPHSTPLWDLSENFCQFLPVIPPLKIKSDFFFFSVLIMENVLCILKTVIFQQVQKLFLHTPLTGIEFCPFFHFFLSFFLFFAIENTYSIGCFFSRCRKSNCCLHTAALSILSFPCFAKSLINIGWKAKHLYTIKFGYLNHLGVL